MGVAMWHKVRYFRGKVKSGKASMKVCSRVLHEAKGKIKKG